MLDLNLVRTRLPDHILNPDPEIYRSKNYVTIDFETTIIGKGLPLYPDNRIVLAAWELGADHPRVSRVQKGRSSEERGHRMFHRFDGEFGHNQLVRDIEAADFIIAHNAKFELGWLARCGLDLTKVIVWDTMLAEYVIGGNRWQWTKVSLQSCAKRHFGEDEGKVDVISALIKAGVCCSEIPRSWLLKYCVQDVRLSRRLFHSQLNALENTRLLPVVYTRCLLSPVLADIEPNGMYLDEKAIATHRAELEDRYGRVMKELEEVTNGINVNSTLQIREYLYDTLNFDELTKRGEPQRTPSGLPKTDQATIGRLKPKNKKQERFLELYKESKELYNELTKYLRKFDECCTEADGWLKGQFNQHATRSQRLSSSGLEYKTQFQNFPRIYKPFFKSRNEGWFVGEGDGSQLEFRAAGHLGRDTQVSEDLINGVDIHSVTAGVIWANKAIAGERHPMRQDAKEHTFKPLYGGRYGTPDEMRYYEFFREKYAGVSATQDRWIDNVLEHGTLETEWGLRYYWPDTKMERSGYIKNSTSICNYPVQAFATAEIIPIGLVYFWHYARAGGLKMLIVNTVHDSIITELPPEEVEDFDQLCYKAMVEEVYGYLDKIYNIELSVPLAAGVSHGERWADDMAKNNEREYTATDNLWRY